MEAWRMLTRGGLANGTDRPTGSPLYSRAPGGASVADPGTSTATATQQVTREIAPHCQTRTGTGEINLGPGKTGPHDHGPMAE
jgi:hypothetical protein